MPLADKLRKEGRQEGRQEALREVLNIQLAERFGALPQLAVSRIDKASEEELAIWIRQLLSVSTLDELFS